MYSSPVTNNKYTYNINDDMFTVLLSISNILHIQQQLYIEMPEYQKHINSFINTFDDKTIVLPSLLMITL